MVQYVRQFHWQNVSLSNPLFSLQGGLNKGQVCYYEERKSHRIVQADISYHASIFHSIHILVFKDSVVAINSTLLHVATLRNIAGMLNLGPTKPTISIKH